MSIVNPNESKNPEPNNAKSIAKCRIPQRLPVKNKSPTYNNSAKAKKYPNVTDSTRPKSATKFKDDVNGGRSNNTNTRTGRIPTYTAPVLKRPSTLPKRLREHPNKCGRPMILVPLVQKPPVKAQEKKSTIMDEDRSWHHEDLDDLGIRRSAVAVYAGRTDVDEDEIVNYTRSEQVIHYKMVWQEKILQFEKMKSNLMESQQQILKLYAEMREIQKKMTLLGENFNLPIAADLSVLNVSNLPPNKLLELCKEYPNYGDGCRLDVCNVDKMFVMPTKLVNTTEQILQKRKEIIDWFESIKSVDKGISMKTLSKKIEEFYAENDMLKDTLDQVKSEFVKEMEDIMKYMKKNTGETMALQLRVEELVYELSELSSQNADLRKQIHNFEYMRPQNKSRMEELEKELKDEKCKRVFLKGRLARAEGQVKINIERASQLDAALEQARAQTWSLERTVQQLHDQNHKLQNDFDKELNKLTESIREHTKHLEEIGEDRERNIAQKLELEKRLMELSDYYQETLSSVKNDLSTNISKLIETEKKYDNEVAQNKELESKIAAIRNELLEVNTKLENTTQLLREKNIQLDSLMISQNEMVITKARLNATSTELEEYKSKLAIKDQTISELEENLKQSVTLQQKLQNDIKRNTDYATELEKKQCILERQLEENETKLEDYVKQLSTLKAHIGQLQNDFGEFENLNELHDIVNKQRDQLAEVNKENQELTSALQNKEEQYEKLNIKLTEQEQMVKQLEKSIKLLSIKDDEHTNIIQILRKNLELRGQADNELNKQLMDKEAEIESLISNIETRKQQISNLEKIILTLENQNQEASLQTKKDHNRIALLQKKIREYEYCIEYACNNDAPAENFDHIIKRIEEELQTPLDSQINDKEYENVTYRKKYIGDRKETEFGPVLNKTHTSAVPTKIVMGNFIKRTYIPSNDDQVDESHLDRKQGITRIKSPKWDVPESEGHEYSALPIHRNDIPKVMLPNTNSKIMEVSKKSEILPLLMQRDARKFKMLKKFAGHRL